MPNDEQKSGLLSIGEFSKATRATIKSLRYYERVGALKPAFVDPDTNYRYYAVSQIFRVGLIRICVEEGLPLEELDQFLADDDILKAAEFFAHISELAHKRWLQSYETMLRMDAYQKEYERQTLLKSESSKTYTIDDAEVMLVVPLGVDIEHFSYAQYNKQITGLFRFANDRKMISLAKQGIYHSEDDHWLVYLQMFDDGHLESKLGTEESIELVRTEPATYGVHNVYDPEIDTCYRKAIAAHVDGDVRFISEGWAYSLVTGMYTIDVLYSIPNLTNAS